jgi:hypothetical protein
MERDEMQIIKELMEELQDHMKYSEDDFGERLGRKKPEVEVMKIEAEPMESEMEGVGMEDEMEGPEDKLKKRLLKLRG